MKNLENQGGLCHRASVGELIRCSASIALQTETTLPGTKKNDSVWMVCISREESLPHLGLSYFQDRTECRFKELWKLGGPGEGCSQRKEELDPKCAAPGPTRQ